MDASLVGRTVDTRYELRRLVARGGMGMVFEAHHRFTRRAVALKLLPPELRTKREARSRLLREAHALTTVRNPGVVEVLDAGVCGDLGPYIVMEMLDGRTLDGILASRRRLSIVDTLVVGRSVCDAVAHAHSRGVVHRDLKPSNFFVARNEVGEERVKVIDLGVAAVAEAQLEAHDQKLTLAHEVIGTPEYMAPEQLWGRPIDERTDVYAIGMSLYECLTGEVPYQGAYPDVLVQVSNANGPPRVRERRPDVPAALANVIERALAKEATDRPQSAAALGLALATAGVEIPARSTLLAPSDDDTYAGDLDSEPERPIQLIRKKGAPAPLDPPKLLSSRRRQFVRAPYVTPVLVVSTSGGEVKGRSEEISEEGMLLISPVPFELGVRVELHFATPVTGEMIALRATVRWMREGRGRCAMGVEFGTVPTAVKGIVTQYISMFPSPH